MFYTKKFIYTQSADPIELRADGGLRKQYPVASFSTVSTIGAGDNFNAGFLYGLIRYGITNSHLKQGLTEEQWDQIIDCGQQFSAEACRSLFNYISPEFGATMREAIKH
jgi:fructokinase